MPTIDVHAHILPRSLVAAHAAGRPWFGTSVSRNTEGRTLLETGARRNQMSTPEYWLDYDERLARLDAAGIDTQVLSLNPQLLRDADPLDIAIEAARAVNEEIAGAVAAHPGRYLGLAAVPLQDAAAAVAELDHAMTVLGLKGLIVGSHVNGRNWSDPDLFAILEAAERLGAFVLLHPLSTRVNAIMPDFHMINLIGNPMETTLAAGSLIFSGAMERLPRLKVCLAHAGGYLPTAIGRFDHGYGERAPLRAACPNPPSHYLKRFYFDMITHSGPGLAQVAGDVGTGRILMGTDFPADMAVAEPTAFLAAQTWLTAPERAAIGGGTAAGLLGLT